MIWFHSTLQDRGTGRLYQDQQWLHALSLAWLANHQRPLACRLMLPQSFDAALATSRHLFGDRFLKKWAPQPTHLFLAVFLAAVLLSLDDVHLALTQSHPYELPNSRLNPYDSEPNAASRQ